MTSAELISKFNIRLEAVASASAPGFTNTEIYSLLNTAENEIIKKYAQLGDYKSIYTVVRTYGGNISSMTLPSGESVYGIAISSIVSSPVRFFIDAMVRVTRTEPTITSEFVKAEIISTSDLSKFVTTNFNKPYFKYPKIIFGYQASTAPHSYIIVIPDYYTTSIDQIQLTYVLAQIGIDDSNTSILPEFLHDDLVDLAVNLAAESIFKTKIPQQG